MSKPDPYSGSKYRITQSEWDELNELFQKLIRQPKTNCMPLAIITCSI
jgi:hypothetical protein